jgi:hypothetical protein
MNGARAPARPLSRTNTPTDFFGDYVAVDLTGAPPALFLAIEEVPFGDDL